MSVAAIGSYEHTTHDAVKNFAQPLLYVAWDEHMIFSAPCCVTISLSTSLEDVVQKILPELYGQHPQFKSINWARVQWFKSATMFTPNMSGSLAEHGFTHKSVLRFRTPGLEGIRGSCG